MQTFNFIETLWLTGYLLRNAKYRKKITIDMVKFHAGYYELLTLPTIKYCIEDEALNLNLAKNCLY